QLVSLELGLGTKDIGELGFQPLIDQASSAIMDVADMAGIIDQLDLVICVDSVAAHVAGAMGKPVWMLTRPGAHWGWLQGRDDSPWYASMSLFRKGPAEDWTDVASSVRQALVHILKGTA
ncbi:MAG: glycosyltransferase, partial [Magnetovibrio sp.]|nr:glycosyltransferase [Magnetovibrio sp.]